MRCPECSLDMSEWKDGTSHQKHWECLKCYFGIPFSVLKEDQRQIEEDVRVFGTGYGRLVDGLLIHVPAMEVLVFKR